MKPLNFLVQFKCGHEGRVYAKTIEGAQAWAVRRLCTACLYKEGT